MRITKYHLAYLAGIIDGEGSIYITRSMKRRNVEYRLKDSDGYSYNLCISVGMANEFVPRLFQMAFGGGVYLQKRRSNWKEIWEWVVSNKQAADVLISLLPFIKIKVEQATKAIEFVEVKPKGRRINAEERLALQNYYFMFKDLNRRGR